MAGVDIPFWVIVLVGLGLLSLFAWLISTLGKAGSDRLTSITLKRLVEIECKPSASNRGVEHIPNLTQFSEISWVDVATQGFSLETSEGTLRWRKRGRSCFYTVERIWTDEEGRRTTQMSEEVEILNCNTS